MKASEPADDALGSNDLVPGPSVQSSNSLPDLLNLVGSSGPGLHTHQLYRRLVELPLPLTRDRLAYRLLREQEVGTLRFRDRRWQAGRELGESDSDAVASTSRIASARYLDTVPADVLPGRPLPTRDDSDQESGPLEGWSLLRRLLPHYRECLRLAGASGLMRYRLVRSDFMTPEDPELGQRQAQLFESLLKRAHDDGNLGIERLTRSVIEWSQKRGSDRTILQWDDSPEDESE